MGKWAKLTANDDLLKFPTRDTFDRCRLDNLKEKLASQKINGRHRRAFQSWENESLRRQAQSQVASLKDQNQKLTEKLKETEKTTQTTTVRSDQTNLAPQTRNPTPHSLYPVLKADGSTDGETTGDEWDIEYPEQQQGQSRETTDQEGKEEQRPKRGNSGPTHCNWK